ncbi:MAG TPA: carbohydrate ABC transporter permease [Anaerolineae bacterium]|nr:carbohydrate ABC transporter permease [Anaerolineae bacterium]HPL28911.1 carbohydrate ABC transporter permease [Anaerolineae bacterium]
MAPWPARTSVRHALGRLVSYALVTLGALIVLVPFAWMLGTSLKARERLFLFPPQWIPNPVVWHNYVAAWNALPVSFTRFLANTLFITVLAMAAELLTVSLVAYGFARFRFRGRDALFIILLATMMLPSVITMIPVFVIWKHLHGLDTYDPLTIGAWFAWGPAYVFMLRQFFMTIPYEMEEAARLDGANTLQIFALVMLPLIKPALLAIGVLSFQGNWNNFNGPLIYLNTLDRFPMVLALQFFQKTLATGAEAPPWNYMMALATIIAIPILALFFMAQRYFIEGITMTGMKG